MPMLAVACVTVFLAIAALRRGDRFRSVPRRPPSAARSWSASRPCTSGGSKFQGGPRTGRLGESEQDQRRPAEGIARRATCSATCSATYQHLTTNYWLAPQINGETPDHLGHVPRGVILGAAPLLVMVISRARSWGWALGLTALIAVSTVSLVVEYQVYHENDELLRPGRGRATR